MWCQDILQDADIIFFCDNVGALAGLIGGHSSTEDTAAILSIFHLLINRLGARIWGEHVESEANIADEPSRQRPATILQKKGFVVRETILPELDFTESAPLSALVNAFGPHAGAAQEWADAGSFLRN